MKMDEHLNERVNAACEMESKQRHLHVVYFIVNNRNNYDFKNPFVFTLQKFTQLNFTSFHFYFATFQTVQFEKN